jgi:hypothetical protein
MDQARSFLSTSLIPFPQKLYKSLCGLRRFHQGVGGAGALPAFQGVGGAGALPAFQGVGGAGADPAAIITVPSPCAVTKVFRPIAPVRINMTRNTTASFFDIYASGDRKHPETLYP